MVQGLLKRSKDMNSYLLIGLESLIDHIGCIRDLGIAYWKKANKKMQIGDIVYLFISDVEHNRVMYRLEVIETDSVRDDKKYWRGTYKHDTSCFKLKNTCGVYHGEGLDHDDLEKQNILYRICAVTQYLFYFVSSLCLRAIMFSGNKVKVKMRSDYAL